MFLISGLCFSLCGNTIKCILSWIEGHPVLLGGFTTVTFGSFWFHRFLKQKRAEAFFGFYARLLLQLKSLDVWLNEESLLNIDCENVKQGNIYALLYEQETLREICPGFHDLKPNKLNDLKKLASQLRSTLLESENNVYPKKSNKKSWYDSQHILFLFCDFIEQDSLRKTINKPIYDSGNNSGKYKHIVRCHELINAISYIQSSIDNENY